MGRDRMTWGFLEGERFFWREFGKVKFELSKELNFPWARMVLCEVFTPTSCSSRLHAARTWHPWAIFQLLFCSNELTIQIARTKQTWIWILINVFLDWNLDLAEISLRVWLLWTKPVHNAQLQGQTGSNPPCGRKWLIPYKPWKAKVSFEWLHQSLVATL